MNTVNCVGLWVAGWHWSFKRAFPDNFKTYAEACRKRQVQPGRMFVHPTDRLDDPR